MRIRGALLLLAFATGLPAVEPLRDFGPGIWVRPGACAVFSGKLLYDQGPEDGLETIAALRASKLHESLIELDTADALRVLAALTVALGEGRGTPPDSLADLPPRGDPAAVSIAWRESDGSWVGMPAAQLIRDRRSDRALPALPAVWSGGALGTYMSPDGSGKACQKQVLTQAGAMCALFDEENGAPLAIAVPNPAEDKCWEANSAKLPPGGTPVMLVVTPLHLQRTLAPDRPLAEALQAAGGPGLRIAVTADRPRRADSDLQHALVAEAARLGVAVAPVFVPAR